MLACCNMAWGRVSLLSMWGHQQGKGLCGYVQRQLQSLYGAVQLSATNRQEGLETPQWHAIYQGVAVIQQGVYLRSCRGLVPGWRLMLVACSGRLLLLGGRFLQVGVSCPLQGSKSIVLLMAGRLLLPCLHQATRP